MERTVHKPNPCLFKTVGFLIIKALEFMRIAMVNRVPVFSTFFPDFRKGFLQTEKLSPQLQLALALGLLNLNPPATIASL